MHIFRIVKYNTKVWGWRDGSADESTALLEVTSSIPSTYKAAPDHVQLQFWGSLPVLFWSPWAWHIHGPYTYM